jgi:hypothetical protein
MKDNGFNFIVAAFIIQRLPSSVGQHILEALLVCLGHERINVEMAFTFLRLAGQDVARVRVAALELARGGRAHAFGRALVCFEFWHNK